LLGVADPVRVYEDFASLDLISRGRAEVIAGRSAFIEPFALFGYDTADYDVLFAEKLGLLLAIRDRENVTWDGRFRPPLKEQP
jgi:alkanesulfonate monooxygenase SsuD/methylene tetrahydromethanopterin reductase-like flavin-dependent oxidoreductase (luciferase family)